MKFNFTIITLGFALNPENFLRPGSGCANIPLVVKNLSFLLIMLLICGCSSSKKMVVSDSLDETPVIAGSVINPSAFEKGGTLVFGLFKPGAGAAADDETDQLSSMLIKGIKDILPQENTNFTIQADDQKDSDLYLEGYIEDYGRKGRSSHLSIDGEIWLRETGEKIFLFQTSTMIDLKKHDPQAVAYQMGVAIAHFIGSHKSSS